MVEWRFGSWMGARQSNESSLAEYERKARAERP